MTPPNLDTDMVDKVLSGLVDNVRNIASSMKSLTNSVKEMAKQQQANTIVIKALQERVLYLENKLKG